MIWSFTKINLYKDCPRQFYKRYIKKDPVENGVPDLYRGGLEFHELMAIFYTDGVVPEELDLYVVQKLKELYNRANVIKENGGDVRIEEVFYLNERMERIDEEDIDFKAEVDKEGNRIWFMGVPDLVTLNDNILIVIEYKHGWRWQVEEEQILTYMYPYYSGQETLIGITATPKNYLYKEFQDDDIFDNMRRIYRRVETIERDIEKRKKMREGFKPNPGSACLTCQYRESCKGLKQNKQIREYLDNPEGLAEAIMGLELKLKELKEIGKEVARRTMAPLLTKDKRYAYNFWLTEKIEGDEFEIFDYVVKKGLNPFNIQAPGWRKPKSLFKLDGRVLKQVDRKLKLDLANLVEVKVEPRFYGRRYENNNKKEEVK